MPGEDPTNFGWEAWSWDETVFRGTAPYYRKGRYPYAPGLAKALADRLGLDGNGRLLDVGCGPGSIALLLAHLFEAVVGVDPDPEMIEEAQRAASETEITNASWVRMRAEALPDALGTFRVVTFAQSFHWMDRPRVAAATRQLLEPGGAVVQVDRAPDGEVSAPDGDPFPPVPDAGIDELRVRWLGPDRRAGQGRRNTSPSDEDEVFQAAGFAPEEAIAVPDDRVIHRSVEEVVARVLSTSSTAPHLFGAKLPDFERDLRALLTKESPQGQFSVHLQDNRLRIRWRD